MLRPAPPVDVKPLMHEERAELLSLLGSLSDEQAAIPTACLPWTVKDLAAHLLGNDISVLSRVRDAHPDPSLDVDPGDPHAMLKWLDGSNESWVQATSFMSLGAIRDLLAATGELTFEHFGALEKNDPGEVVSWAGPEVAPNWLCVGREFTERWVHQQQIRDALERPGLNGPSFVTPALSILVRGIPPAYSDTKPPVGTTVEVSVAGRGGGAWAVRRAARGWDLLDGREREVDAKVVLDQDTMWRFLTRNVDASVARAKAQLEGPEELTDPFFDAVSAMVRTG